ncbi:MAG: type II toxin-antitoxin system HicA family toxin [bacterium]|nr:type II toxin-antitoxin system HicA family toxin [bacterium]
MNPQLPRVTARELITVLRKRGFLLIRSSGRHQVFRDPKGNRAVIPVHSGKIMRLKTLSAILKDAEISIEDFIRELK